MNKFAATLLSILLAVPGLAQAISLQDLAAGGSIQVEDKLFDNWFVDDFSLFAIDLSAIDVTGLAGDPLNPGLLYTVSNNALIADSARGGGFDSTLLDFGFDVTVLDPNLRVKDNSLQFGEGNALTTDEGTFAAIDITEFIFDGMDLIGEKEITFDSDGTFIGSDSAVFAPLTMISIETSILLLADDNGVDGVATASLGSFTQNFSQERVQVPEPASLALLGLGLAGLGFTRRRRARA